MKNLTKWLILFVSSFVFGLGFDIGLASIVFLGASGLVGLLVYLVCDN